MQCFYQRDDRAYSLEEERRRAARFFEDGRCGEKPTILPSRRSWSSAIRMLRIFSLGSPSLRRQGQPPDAVIGVLRSSGRARRHGRRRRGNAALPRHQRLCVRAHPRDPTRTFCWSRAISRNTTTRRTGAIPAISTTWSRARRRLHRDGVRSIVVAGQVPTWAPILPILVGRDILERGEAAEFSRIGVRPDSLETDRALAAKDWGEGVAYISQAKTLCGAEGCRRVVGRNLPEDLLAVDYGHYSVNGSIFAVKTMLAPVIEAEIARSRQ